MSSSVRLVPAAPFHLKHEKLVRLLRLAESFALVPATKMEDLADISEPREFQQDGFVNSIFHLLQF